MNLKEMIEFNTYLIGVLTGFLLCMIYTMLVHIKT